MSDGLDRRPAPEVVAGDGGSGDGRRARRRRPSPAWPLLIVVGLLAGVSAACGGGDGPTPAGSRTIEAGGVAWHAVVRGPSVAKARHTVLFLHGASYTSRIWADRGILDEVAATGDRGVAVDLPGSGQTPDSDRPKADVLADLVAEVGAPGRTVVVSPSASGTSSLALLHDRPDVVLAGFVAVAPTGIDDFTRPADAPALPALLVWGANDDVVPFALARRLSEQFPGSRTERIPDASHAPYDDAPEAFVDVLSSFLDDLDP